MTAIFIRFPHGLGDVCQFSVVLKHLRKYRPWEVDVRCGRGKHTALTGLCRHIYHDAEPEPIGHYDSKVTLGWYENYNRYTDRPNSKITSCLAEVFGIDYDPFLGRYEVQVPLEAWPRVQAYLESIGAVPNGRGKHRAVVLHYQGNTSGHKKNLSHAQAEAICREVERMGRPVVLLDWDRRSALPDDRTVFCPRTGPGDLWGGTGTGDAATIAALIGQCEAFVGIDSGPGKIASATVTPSLVCWTGHHPLQFHDPAPNTDHLLPVDWINMAPLSGSHEMADYFRKHYTFGTYAGEHSLVERVTSWLSLPLGMGGFMSSRQGLVLREGFFCHEGMDDLDFVVIDDVFNKDAYRTAMISSAGSGEVVIDVGAHIGVFAKLWHQKNPQARIICVECCPENLPALHANVDEFAVVLEAACTSEKGGLTLLNSVGSWGQSTGGSRVVTREEMEACTEAQYWHDTRPLVLMSLEDVMASQGVDHVDLLKLDCEGSEFSILEHAPLEKIGFIVMETHDPARWRELMARRFAGWDVGHLSESGNFENWHLRNPYFRRQRSPGR